MVRSMLVFAFLFIVSVGCSPEAAKEMTDKAAASAKEAAGDIGGGVSGMMDKATEALSGVEGGSEMLKQVTDLFASATKTLSGVKDADSATAALPDLGKLTEGFGGMTEMFSKLPDAAKVAVGGVFQSSLGQLQPIIDKVMAIPGVEAILKPAIDALMSKLEAFK